MISEVCPRFSNSTTPAALPSCPETASHRKCTHDAFPSQDSPDFAAGVLCDCVDSKVGECNVMTSSDRTMRTAAGCEFALRRQCANVIGFHRLIALRVLLLCSVGPLHHSARRSFVLLLSSASTSIRM